MKIYGRGIFCEVRGLNLHLSGCNPHPTLFQSTNSENGNDPLLHRFRINKGLCYHNKVKRKWQSTRVYEGPKLEKEILFYKSPKVFADLYFQRTDVKRRVHVCVCLFVFLRVCECVCVLTTPIHGLVLYPEFWDLL